MGKLCAMSLGTLEVKHAMVTYKLFSMLVNSGHALYKIWTNFFAGSVNFASGIQEKKPISCMKMYIIKIDLYTVEMQDARVIMCIIHLILYSINLHQLSPNMKKIVAIKIETNSNNLFIFYASC